MGRMTKEKLKTRLDWVNDALGEPREAYTITDDGLRVNAGVVTLDWAYGGVRVCRMVGPGGGETDLSLRGNMRDAAAFLDAGINIARGKAK